MHSVAINHLIIFILHACSSVFLFMLVPNDDASNAVDAMKASLGFDILTLSGNCPEAAATEVTTTAAATGRRRLLSTAGCSLVRTETHEAVFEGIDIIMLLAVNEAITAVSHLIGFAGWWMSEASWKADSRHLEVLRRQSEYAITATLLELGILFTLGGNSLYAALFIVFGNICIQVLGYVIERTSDMMRQYYLLATGTLLLLPIIVLITHHADKLVGMDHALTLAILYTVLYLLFALHLFAHISYQWYRAMIDKDHGFQLLGAATKLGLTWLAVTMLHHTYSELGLPKLPEMGSGLDLEGLTMGLIIGTIALVVLGFAGLTQLPKDAEYMAIAPLTTGNRRGMSDDKILNQI